MKIIIAYPPIVTGKGTPLLSQNRQFQWFNNPCYIYPVVPAYAATMLRDSGFDVLWMDGIASGTTLEEYLQQLKAEKPDYIAMETKTPVVKYHWSVIEEIKKRLPETKVVLMGDHVTAMPAESMQQSRVDYVLTGGDYDFLLVNLMKHLTRGDELEPGIWYRENGGIANTGQFQQNHDLKQLPFIDRDLTQWRLYAEKNGNFKRLPGTYTMAGRDCWWHRCSFCSWTTLYPKYRVRTPESLLDEIGMLIENYGVREIFDDTGSFPVGEWLEKFCRGMIERGYSRKVRISCNMKFGILEYSQYRLMREAGFRYLLFGMESARQETLDAIDKGIEVRDVTDGCHMAKAAGLEPHLTIMIGYPWETLDDARSTLALAKGLFNKGYADTLQATIVVPYPGTPLFRDCLDKGLLTTTDWNEYDMRKPVMQTPCGVDEVNEMNQSIYRIFFSPKYILRRLLAIRNIDDLRFIQRGIKAVFGHLKDFSLGERNA